MTVSRVVYQRRLEKTVQFPRGIRHPRNITPMWIKITVFTIAGEIRCVPKKSAGGPDADGDIISTRQRCSVSVLPVFTGVVCSLSSKRIDLACIRPAPGTVYKLIAKASDITASSLFQHESPSS
jgi:hypothetical protein